MSYRITNFDKGYILQNTARPRNVAVMSGVSRKRGKITGFSRKSARRLREFLLRNEVIGAQHFAITLTIPRATVNYESWCDVIERFRSRMLRRNIPLVWRIELQKSKTPHLHIIAYLRDYENEIFYIWSSWVQCSKQFVKSEKSADGFLVYCFACQRVSSLGWFRYVLSHTVKHKDSQLGWHGRQWGIICKSIFTPVTPIDLTISEEEAVYLLRVIRRSLGIHGYNKNCFDALRMQSLCLFGGIQKCHDYYQNHITPF